MYASEQTEAHICTTFMVYKMVLFTFSHFLFKTDMWNEYYFTIGNRYRHDSVL